MRHILIGSAFSRNQLILHDIYSCRAYWIDSWCILYNSCSALVPHRQQTAEACSIAQAGYMAYCCQCQSVYCYWLSIRSVAVPAWPPQTFSYSCGLCSVPWPGLCVLTKLWQPGQWDKGDWLTSAHCRLGLSTVAVCLYPPSTHEACQDCCCFGW